MRRDFPRLSRPASGPTQPPVQWVPGLSRGQRRPGRDADHTPPSSAEVKKELSYTFTHPMGLPEHLTGFPLPPTFGRNVLFSSSGTEMTQTVPFPADYISIFL